MSPKQNIVSGLQSVRRRKINRAAREALRCLSDSLVENLFVPDERIIAKFRHEARQIARYHKEFDASWCMASIKFGEDLIPAAHKFVMAAIKKHGRPEKVIRSCYSHLKAVASAAIGTVQEGLEFPTDGKLNNEVRLVIEKHYWNF